MDGSDEVNEMRAASYKCIKGTYPPKEVKLFFEHVRQCYTSARVRTQSQVKD